MNEQETLAVFGKVGAAITGSHVVYASGQHGSEYVNKDALYPHVRETSQVCLEIAMRYRHDHVDVVIAPAIGGVILSQWTAHHLSVLNRREVLAVYAERDEESICKASEETTITVGEKVLTLQRGDEVVVKRSSFVIKRGYDRLVAGKRLLAVEDVLTTGGSARKVIEASRAAQGEVVGLHALYNRGGVSAQQVGAPSRLDSLVSVQLQSWPEADCPLCAQHVPINTDVGKGRAFLARQQKQ